MVVQIDLLAQTPMYLQTSEQVWRIRAARSPKHGRLRDFNSVT